MGPDQWNLKPEMQSRIQQMSQINTCLLVETSWTLLNAHTK